MDETYKEMFRRLGENDSLEKLGVRDITYKIHVQSNLSGKYEEKLMGTRLRCAKDKFRMDVIMPNEKGTALGDPVSGVYYPQEVVVKIEDNEWTIEQMKYEDEKNTAAPFVQAKMAKEFIAAEKNKIKFESSNGKILGRNCVILKASFDANDVNRTRLNRLGISLEGSSEMPSYIEYWFDQESGVLLAWTLCVEATKKGLFLTKRGKVILREEAVKYNPQPSFSREVFEPKKFARTRFDR
ncbi:MAG: hypothetical protein QXT63_09570 [Thermoplasmata archaeon]